MKRVALSFVSGLCLIHAFKAQADSFGVEVARGARWVQSAPATVVAAPGSAAVYFQARALGLSGFAPVTGAQVKTPKSAVLPLSDPGDGVFSTVQNFTTAALRDAAFPVGRYDFSASLNFLGLVRAHVGLTDSAAPAAPWLLNQAEAQAIDPDSEFTLTWSAFSTAGVDDLIDVELRDAVSGDLVDGGTDLDPATTEWTVSPGVLVPSHAYTLRIAFRKIGALSVPDSNEVLTGHAAWVSETTVGVETSAGGSGGQDTVPPSLAQVVPSEGGAMTTALDFLVFSFSEAMDPAGRSVTLQATLNGVPVTLSASSLQLLWVNDNKTLACSYGQATGGWPAGLRVTWVLNDHGGMAGNLTDAAGNELPRATGTFTTAGGIDPCSGHSVGSLPSAAFFFSKQVHYLQSGTDAPTGDPALGAEALALFNAPSFATSTAIVTLKVPTSNPFQFLLKVLTPPDGATDFSFRSFSQKFASRADLDAVYIGGDYAFELRDSQAKATNSVLLSVPASGYPPTPHFSNYTAAQSIDVSSAFSLGWDSFSGATTNTAAVSLVVFDSASNVVFQVPDPCHGVALDPAAAGVSIPAGTFKAGAAYVAELDFGRITDRDKTLAGVPGVGFALLRRTTRMALHAAGGASLTAPKFTGVHLQAPGTLRVQITCTPGHDLVVEGAPAIGGTYTPMVTTNPPASPLTLDLAVVGPRRIIRARNP